MYDDGRERVRVRGLRSPGRRGSARAVGCICDDRIHGSLSDHAPFTAVTARQPVAPPTATSGGGGAARDAPEGTARRPRVSIRPRHSWLPAHPKEIWAFRSLLTRLAARDITLRYRQTALGVAWVVLQPLIGAGILSFVFGTIADLPGPPGIPYIVFSFVGMVAWTTFSQTLLRASTSLVSNSAMVSKVYFPRLLLPLSTSLSAALDVIVCMLMLAVLLVATGVAPSLPVLLLPVWLALLVGLGLGGGMAAGALMVRYRDVQFSLPVAVQFLLYASPIVYSLAVVPRSARSIYNLNPLSGLLEGFRWSVLNTPRPSTGLIVYSTCACVVLFLGGLMMFTRMERQFADVI